MQDKNYSIYLEFFSKNIILSFKNEQCINENKILVFCVKSIYPVGLISVVMTSYINNIILMKNLESLKEKVKFEKSQIILYIT